MKNPAEVKLAVSKPAERKINGMHMYCYETQKLAILERLFKMKILPPKVAIFSSSKQKVKELARTAKKLKIHVAEMHSDLDQNERKT